VGIFSGAGGLEWEAEERKEEREDYYLGWKIMK
jgi:hypothetical protein